MKRYPRILGLAVVGLFLLLGVPARAAAVPLHSQTTARASSAVSASDALRGKQNVAYFTQWGIYSGYFVKNIVTSGSAAKLTTIDYAFGNISPDLKCFEVNQAGQGDAWADYQRPASADESVNGVADSWSQNLRGNFNQLRELKQMYPNLKILLSIGGWTWSGHFSAAAEPQNRAAFVQSCIDLYIKGNLPQLDGDIAGGPGSAAGIFDGFDIDWEYPDNPGNGNPYGPQDTQNYTGLLAEFRQQLDTLGQQTHQHYLLTVAAPAGQDKYDKIQLNRIWHSLDWINLMTYDMHGPWDANGPTDFNAPLFASPADPSPPPANSYSINHAVVDYLRAGVPPHKLVIGIPFYGHGWTNVPDVHHGLYQSSPAMQPAPDGAGTENFNVLETLNYPSFRDPITQAFWIYNGSTFWSYDDPVEVHTKMVYIRLLGLGGAMEWSLDGDDASGTLMSAIYNGLRPGHG